MAGKTLTILDPSDIADLSLTDAMDYAKSLGIDVNDETENIVGLRVINKDDKATLVGVPFFLLSWQFREGDNGEFVSAVIAFQDGSKAVVNDGSTGIRDQLKGLTADRIAAGHPTPQALRMVSKGLRRSDYTNEHGAATTYYLAG